MPLEATPITPVNPETQVNSVAAKQTYVAGCPVIQKLQAHEVKQGQDARLLWTIKDPDGNPFDLTEIQESCGLSEADGTHDALTASCGVNLRLRELSGVDPSTNPVVTVPVEVVDAEAGLVRAEALPDSIMREPGVFMTEWGVMSPEQKLLFSNTSLTFVNRGLFGQNDTLNGYDCGPPTIQEIRVSIRDNDPADNLLLDDLEFDATEIAQAVIRPIQFWNEIPPPIRPLMTTKTFPFKEMWLLGIQSVLFDIAASHYRRAALPYSAGGVSVDDKNKEKEYLQISRLLRAQFEDLVKAKKIEINTRLMVGMLGSGYGGRFW